MGTNYYLQSKPPCQHCGRKYENKHIGKSSAGWHFSLHVYPEEGIFDLPDWIPLLKSGIIEDEYGTRLTMEQLVDQITNRYRIKDTPYSKETLDINHAEIGLHNLLRSRLDTHCIKHGQGTWDCIVGDFS